MNNDYYTMKGCRTSGCTELYVPVPQECMGRNIGTGGNNIKQLARETRTRIKTCNEDNVGKRPGFLVIGTPSDCEDAQLAIRRRIDKGSANIKEPVPQQFVRLLTKRNGSDGFRVIEEKCGVKITWPKINGTEQNVIFDIKGMISSCEQAREMIRENLKRWEIDGVCQKSELEGDDRARKIDVPKKYIHIVVGKGRKNIDGIQTKTETKIIVPSREKTKAQDGDTVQLKIIGPPKKCDGAEARIRHCIAFHKEKMLRDEFGGDKHFVCFAYSDENETFQLKPCVSAPVLNDFIQRQRYRIETEVDYDGDDDDYRQREFSDKTILDIKDHLMTPLQNLKMLKDEKQLMADLWCHFGKVFVSCVDEEHIQDTFTPVEINTRVKKVFSQATSHNQETDGHWRVSFEEGINQTDINDGQLPKSGEANHGFLDLKLVHTQWRYDFGFTTPTYRSVRLKVWEGLPPDRDEPPVEVKNILRRVFLQGLQDINAWLCYPSISVLRGEVMTPNSLYDCRMKLRAGSRYVTAKDSICIEEDDILADYLSNCKLDQEKHCMRLPDEKEHEIPEGFDCVYFREAKEIMYEVAVDEESFTVIVLDEQGWDSDTSERRDKKQFGIRVVMNSWSDAMLSPEQHWVPEEILQKLENYMTFLSILQNHLFGDG